MGGWRLEREDFPCVFGLLFPGIGGQFHVFFGDVAWGAGGRDVEVGGPEDAVDDGFAEVGVGEVFVKVSADESEGSAFVGAGAIVGPADGKFFAVDLGGSHGANVFEKLQVDVILFTEEIASPAAADGVFRVDALNGRFADVVLGEVGVEPPAECFEELFANVAGGGAGGPVDGGQADAFVEQLLGLLAVRLVEQEITAHGDVEDDRIGAGQNGGIHRPAVGNDGLDIGGLLQAFGQQLGVGHVLVGAVGVVSVFADEDDFGGGEGVEGDAQQEDRCQSDG